MATKSPKKKTPSGAAGAKRTRTRAKPSAARPKRQPRAKDEPLDVAARRAAELLGMDPEQVAKRAEKLREQANQASQRVLAEVEQLAERADELSEKFDHGVKEGIRRLEQLADDLKNKKDFSTTLEKNAERVTREAVRIADEASVEVKRMYEQARGRLTDILNKRR